MALGPIKYKILKQTNPRLNLQRILCLKALYHGGARLLEDDKILSTILPAYSYESQAVYAERKKRAYYENVFAMVVNQISAGLAQDPVHLDESAENADQYWKDLMEDATPITEDGSRKKSFDQVVRDAAVEGLTCGWSWVQADLPNLREEGRPTTLLEQEQSGGLRAYVVPWATECVTDWEEEDGHLLWVKTYRCEMRAKSPAESRDVRIHTWIIWEPDSWTRYVVEENAQGGSPLPNDEVEISPVEDGNHSFGRVPWVRFDLCSEGGVQLHVGDAIESLCRAYFNRQNGESFQWVQFYYQQLYEFLAPEIAGVDTPISEAQQDPMRAHRRRAPGMVHVRGAGDKAQFVGPNMAGAAEGRAASADLRDSILRATAQMALSQDTSGAMLRRSAESKKQDAVAQEIVLGAIGKKLLVMANAIAELLAHGRGDKEAPRLRGYERFDVTDADVLLDRARIVASINIPSATYQTEHLYQVAVTDLGDSVSEEVKKKIREELEQAITQDQLMGMGTGEKLPPIEHDDDSEFDIDEVEDLVDAELEAIS